jgi:hypothetical protein
MLPVLRALIAKELINKHGFTQTQAAALLGVSQAAINYYLDSKRGRNTQAVKEIKGLNKTAKNIAKHLSKGEINYPEMFRSICSLCMSLRKNGAICKIHEKDLPTLKAQGCKVCNVIKAT